MTDRHLELMAATVALAAADKAGDTEVADRIRTAVAADFARWIDRAMGEAV